VKLANTVDDRIGAAMELYRVAFDLISSTIRIGIFSRVDVPYAVEVTLQRGQRHSLPNSNSARRRVDAGSSNYDVAPQSRVDHPRVFQIEECEGGNKDEREDSMYGEPHGREDASNQALSRLFSVEYPGLRLLSDGYQGSTNSRSFQLRRAVRFLLI